MHRIFLTLIVVLSAGNAKACPTCYGALVDYSPPFFSEEAYTPFAQDKQPTLQSSNSSEERHEEGKSTSATDQPARE